MDVKEAIQERRAYRSFEPVDITREIVGELAEAARLAPSCNNNQPWRFVFAYDKEVLGRLHEALPEGNRWVKSASMIIAVFSRREDDCVIKDREYNLFDTGLAVGQMLLRATELGLVAHPIAGYNPVKVREVLGIPDAYQVITLINVGRHSSMVPDYFSDNQKLGEKQRPPRKPAGEIAYTDGYKV